MPFGSWAQVAKESYIRWGAHWRHLGNMTEPSMWGSDVALCRITLATCCVCVCQLKTWHTEPSHNVTVSSYVIISPTRSQQQCGVELRHRDIRSFTRTGAPVFLGPQWTHAGRRLRIRTECYSTATTVCAIIDRLSEATTDSRRYVPVINSNQSIASDELEYWQDLPSCVSYNCYWCLSV